MNLRQKLEDEKQIEKVIRILGNMHPEDKDLENYQNILNKKAEEYSRNYGGNYGKYEE